MYKKIKINYIYYKRHQHEFSLYVHQETGGQITLWNTLRKHESFIILRSLLDKCIGRLRMSFQT